MHSHRSIHDAYSPSDGSFRRQELRDLYIEDEEGECMAGQTMHQSLLWSLEDASGLSSQCDCHVVAIGLRHGNDCSADQCA